MKGLFATVFALLLVLSLSMISAPACLADDDAGTGTNALCTTGHLGGSGDGGTGEPEGDLEGDPENWLGGQNSVVEPADDPTVVDAVITWIKKVVNKLAVTGD